MATKVAHMKTRQQPAATSPRGFDVPPVFSYPNFLETFVQSPPWFAPQDTNVAFTRMRISFRVPSPFADVVITAYSFTEEAGIGDVVATGEIAAGEHTAVNVVDFAVPAGEGLVIAVTEGSWGQGSDLSVIFG